MKIKKKYLDLNIIPYTKVYSKWIMDLNVKHKIVKLLFKKAQEKMVGI